MQAYSRKTFRPLVDDDVRRCNPTPPKPRPKNARLLPFWPTPRRPPWPAHRSLPQSSPPTARRRKHDPRPPKSSVPQRLRLHPLIEAVDPLLPPPHKKSQSRTTNHRDRAFRVLPAPLQLAAAAEQPGTEAALP